MQKFLFHSDYAIHESGSKYYQIITIQKLGTTSGVLVTHWGAMHPGAPSEPKNHGQRKIALLSKSIGAEANAALRGKKKRGYETWTVGADRVCSENELIDLLQKWFKTADQDEILDFLFSGFEYSTDEFDTPDEYEPMVAEVKTVKHEEWGSW